MDREEALKLIKEHVTNKNLIKHMLAVEAIMREVASHLDEDEEDWGLAGLLHDLDYSLTEKTPEKHTSVTKSLLKGLVGAGILHAIMAHNEEHSKVKPSSKMSKALIAADALSGLLVATALVVPTQKIKDVNIDLIKKKFKSKDFAKAINRDRILKGKETGIDMHTFYELALESLKKISKDINL